MAQTKPSKQTKPQPGTGMQHPEEYRSDLNPNANAGQNIGVAGTHPEKEARTAYEIKELHRQLKEMSDADLKQIPVMPAGSRLEQGATYLDLNDPQRQEFTASGDMTAEADHYYVPKTEVPYQLWNRLLGIENPARIGTGNAKDHVK